MAPRDLRSRPSGGGGPACRCVTSRSMPGESAVRQRHWRDEQGAVQALDHAVRWKAASTAAVPCKIVPDGGDSLLAAARPATWTFRGCSRTRSMASVKGS
jgi:hypothetical protein